MDTNVSVQVTEQGTPMLTGTPAVRERNYGIDLLRMVSMLFVTVLHVLGQGGVLGASAKLEDPLNNHVAWFLEIAAYCCVNCYALISGYVGVKSKFKYSNIVMLWLQVFFYTGIITLLFSHFYPEMVGEQQIWNMIFPAAKNQYWYFTAYFAMFFFIPFYNYAVNHMPQKQMRVMIIAAVILFSFLPSVFRTELFGAKISNTFYISSGYNMMWLSVLYVIGAYVSKYNSFSSIPKPACFLTYFVAVIATHLFKFCTDNGSVAVNYTSPTILIAGFALLIGFSRLKFPRSVRAVIKFMSPAAFGVYLVHVHPLIWEKFMKLRYYEFGSFDTWYMVVAVLVAALVIYLFCSCIDLVRHYLFKLLHLRQGLEWLEKKLCRDLWQER
ncbi:MAG: acyltransferase [Clostridia bacterium]|nr:acyltransferase [Clostridia bacterium]